MSEPISDHHPLRDFFSELIRETFTGKLGMDETPVREYLSNLLTDFVHVDRIYCIRTSEGRQLDQIADVLYEGELLLNAGSFSRERQVHKHIGDMSLFWTGLFPEGLERLRHPTRKDHLVNYVRQGKESYYIVSTFDVGKWREEADLFRELSEQFELYMNGLTMVRHEWERVAGFGR